MDSAANVVAMSIALVNTNLAAAAGVVVAVSVSRPLLGRVDLHAVLNGAIAGLVSITAGPDIVDHQWAIVIGGIGGLISTVGLKVLEFFKVDDGVGAIPAHLFAGIWGTIAVCIAAGGNFGVQLIGIVAIGAFVFGSSFCLVDGSESRYGCSSDSKCGRTWTRYGGTWNRSLSGIYVHA